MLGLGIIGMGQIGRLHASNMVERGCGGRLVQVFDPFLADEARRWLAEHPQVKVGPDLAALWANPEVEAVLICSASSTHTALIEAAAKAGKHIFCEKPLGLDLAEIHRALLAVERAGVKLQMGFNRRFDANFVEIKRGVAAGEIGSPQLLRICSRDPEPPPIAYIKASGGLFLDMMIHDFDLARFLFGEVVEVEARGAALIDPSIGELGEVDTAVATLRFASGALGVIDNSFQATYGYDQRVEVFGSKGMLLCDNEFPHAVKSFHGAAVSAAKPHYFFLERYRESYAREIHAFVTAIGEGRAVAVNGYDGLRAVEIGLRARDSCREGSASSVCRA